MVRAESYKKLIRDVKALFSSYVLEDGKIQLTWCSECDEINLWTYWQGRDAIISNSDVKIMVVGQDWGTPANNEQVMTNIRAINKGRKGVSYLDKVKMFPTDEALIKIFDEILDMDITTPCPDLFFTNYCLGYRTGKQSGGMKYKQMIEGKNQELFKRLVDIVKPDVIVPLGQITYKAVCKALDIARPQVRGYNRLLDKQNKEDLHLVYVGGGFESEVVPMAHPGIYGQMNRKNGDDKGFGLMLKDWGKVKCHIE